MDCIFAADGTAVCRWTSREAAAICNNKHDYTVYSTYAGSFQLSISDLVDLQEVLLKQCCLLQVTQQRCAVIGAGRLEAALP